uniref:Uncharacterized protein n=1 Tax=Ulva partita TaxID=1605170 RepID=A0A1C9ZRX2_9CHLO|nr:hypothetical protein [Ulva partita]
MHDDDAAQKLVAHLREMQVHDEPVFDKPAWLEQHEPAMRTKLEALDVNQREIDKLLVAFLQERQDLEMKYEGLLGRAVANASLHQVKIN